MSYSISQSSIELPVLDPEILAAVRDALRERDADAARAKLTSRLEDLALDCFPDSERKEVRNRLEAEYNRAFQHLQHLKAMRDAQAPLTILHRTVNLRDVNFVDQIFGGISLFAMFAALGVVPLVSAVTLTEAGKIALFADSASFAAVFGVTGLGGMVAMSAYRDTYNTDEARRRFDQRMKTGAVFSTIFWITTLALSAYPATFGAEALTSTSDGWGSPSSMDEDAGGFTLAIPTAFTLIATGLMEVFSGAVFKIIASDKLTPKRTVGSEKNPALDVFNGDLIPSADIELDAAQAKLSDFEAAEQREKQQRGTFVAEGLSRFDTLVSRARSAASEAIDQTLIEASQREADSASRPTVTRH